MELSEKLTKVITSITLPFEQLLIDQQRAAWFTNSSSKMNEMVLCLQSYTLRPVDGKTD